MIASLGVSEMFEIGCGDGSVITCAEQLGIASAGIDISAHARSRAKAGTMEKIRLGDLLEAEDLRPMELTCAFDLVEHISPNKIDAFIRKVRSLATRGGLVIFNTPAFGNDRIFGLIHTYWLSEWMSPMARGTLWTTLPCDENGSP